MPDITAPNYTALQEVRDTWIRSRSPGIQMKSYWYDQIQSSMNQVVLNKRDIQEEKVHKSIPHKSIEDRNYTDP